MCDRAGSHPFTEFSSTSEPKGPNYCHIYYVHQDGFIFHHPDALFSDAARSLTRVMAVKSEGDITNPISTTKYESLKRVRRVRSEGNIKRNMTGAFCGEDRLTLVSVLA